MIEKDVIVQVLGSLMLHPQFLSEVDKYNLTLTDFEKSFEKYIFASIDGLYRSGSSKIEVIDIDNYLSSNSTGKALFDKNNGIEYLQYALDNANVASFDYYYNKLKKFNLLTSLKKMGIATEDFYCEDLFNERSLEINSKFEQLTCTDIIEEVKKKILGVEKNYRSNEIAQSGRAIDGIEDILTDALEGNDIGLPIQGDIFNQVLSGARLGTFVVRSGSSGTGKSRSSAGDACLLAYPLRYNQLTFQWEQKGGCEKVLFITTELTIKEIQRMILAYLTGINESKFRYGGFTKEEEQIIQQAIEVMKIYEDNFYIIRMPNPTTELLKLMIREHCLMYNIQYVFFDYIFICPSLIKEFDGQGLRNDEVLLIMSTVLKDLAVELNIFVMTSTQTNANADNNQNIRNESAIAGSRAVINKADIGCVMARPTNDELQILKQSDLGLNEEPNLVTDIYKVRSGEWNQIRIWSYVDFGTLRKKDLFATNSRMEAIKDLYSGAYDCNTIDFEQELNTQIIELVERLNKE